MRIGALLVLTAAVVVAAGAFALHAVAGDNDKSDRSKFQGTWRLVSWEEDGKAMAADDVKKVRMTIKSDRFVLTMPEGTTEGTFTMNGTTKPKAIDVASAKGRFEGKTVLGVYELSDDTYKACFAAPGQDRPKVFAADKGSGHILFVFKRETAKP